LKNLSENKIRNEKPKTTNKIRILKYNAKIDTWKRNTQKTIHEKYTS
jgi:hypothetical protein